MDRHATLLWAVLCCVAALSATHNDEGSCDLTLVRELPLGRVVLPPVPTELSETGRLPRILNVTSYWHGIFQGGPSHRYNFTRSWALEPSLRSGFLRICNLLVGWQVELYSVMELDEYFGIEAASNLWLALAGNAQGLETDVLEAAKDFPASVYAAVRKWASELVSYALSLNARVIQKAEAMPGEWGKPKRLFWVIADAVNAATETALVGPGFVDSLLMLYCLGSPRLGAWEFHAELGVWRHDALSFLANRSGKSRPRVLELGVNSGLTSIEVIANVPGVAFLGVDPYLEEDEQEMPHAVQSAYDAAVKAAGRSSSALLVRLRSEEAAMSVDLWRSGWDKVDVVFIDTEKSYAAASRDILLWAPRVQPGGCVSGHDFCSWWMGTASAVLDMIPRGATLHLGPDFTWWWCVNERLEHVVEEVGWRR
eukprot:TRINITY_DN49582_c0_g1_i1.p1 TRINITY_DN49582_c0_g1~~TRINITY_DN49582_c0_g1_i1.p1  ORF type:complete len:425 (+),score=63.01 TRINITY_DN49582_c0_g1_i1:128-1402(+)